MHSAYFFFRFFFNDTATTEIYTLSLHDALPICLLNGVPDDDRDLLGADETGAEDARPGAREAQHRALDPSFARAALEHRKLGEPFAHVCRGGGRSAARGVCAGPDQRAAEGLEEREGDEMVGAAQGDGRPAGGDGGRDNRRPWQPERDW